MLSLRRFDPGWLPVQRCPIRRGSQMIEDVNCSVVSAPLHLNRVSLCLPRVSARSFTGTVRHHSCCPATRSEAQLCYYNLPELSQRLGPLREMPAPRKIRSRQPAALIGPAPSATCIRAHNREICSRGLGQYNTCMSEVQSFGTSSSRINSDGRNTFLQPPHLPCVPRLPAYRNCISTCGADGESSACMHGAESGSSMARASLPVWVACNRRTLAHADRRMAQQQASPLSEL